MSENLMETEEGRTRMMKVIVAAEQFVRSPAFEQFLTTSELSTGMAVLMAEMLQDHPALLLVGDAWPEIFSEVLALGIVCWEDQALTVPERPR